MALTERYVTADSDGGDGSSGNPWTLSEAIAGCAAGDRINILSGTYTRTASDTIAIAGTVGSPIIFRGVTSFSPLTAITPTRTNGGALVTTGMPVIAYDAGYALNINATLNLFQGLNITGNVNGGLVVWNFTGASWMIGCVSTNASAAASAQCFVRAAGIMNFSQCDGTNPNSSSYVWQIGSSGGWCINCRAMPSATGYGFSTAVAAHFIGCVVTDGVNGITLPAVACTVNGCTIYSQSGAAIRTANAAMTAPHTIINNLFVGNAYALLNPYNATAAHPLISVNNCYYNNTNANLGFGDWPEQGRIDLASDPFVNAAGGDFRLSPGSLARNAGLGGVDCGAIQHVDPTQPAASAVWDGTSYNDGLTTGTKNASDIANCEAGNIKDGVTIDDVTGTYDNATNADYVIEEQGGNYQTPTDAQVQAGVANGVAGTGTYDPVTGNYTDPGVAKVQDGETYTFAGDLKTGTYDPITGNYTDPGVANVKTGETYEFAGDTKTGTYDPVTGQYTDPGVENVESGVEYEFAGETLTGTLEGGGYTYGDDNPNQVLTTATGAGSYVPIADSDTVDGGVAYGAGEEGTGVNATTILSALGLATGNLDTQLAGIKAETAEIVEDTAAIGTDMTKVKAAVYDSAPMGNDGYIVLSNGTRVLVSAAGWAITES